MTPEQEAKLNEVYEFKKKLQATGTIPLDVDRAFRTRLLSDIQTQPITLDATNPGNTRAVNEGGLSSYNVMAPADEFAFVTIDGVTYNVPLFNV